MQELLHVSDLCATAVRQLRAHRFKPEQLNDYISLYNTRTLKNTSFTHSIMVAELSDPPPPPRNPTLGTRLLTICPYWLPPGPPHPLTKTLLMTFLVPSGGWVRSAGSWHTASIPALRTLQQKLVRATALKVTHWRKG